MKFKDPSGFGPGDVSRMQPAWTNEYSGGLLGAGGGNGGVSIGQIVGATVAGVLGYVFAENVVGSEAEQPGTSTTGQNKSNSIDWVKNPPKDPAALGDEWEDTTHPEKKKNAPNSTDYTNKETGEKISFDKAKPGQPGWEGKDHWHRHNPDSKTPKLDKYLDQNGKPTGKGSDPSHIPAGS